MKTDRYIKVGLPSDDELDLLTDYIGGLMTTAEVEAFKRRMEEDDEFFFRVAPVVDGWYSPDSLSIGTVTLAELERREAEERRHAVVSRPHRARRWRRPFMAVAGVGSLVVAAEVLFVIVQAGLRVGPTVAPMVAHVADPKPSPAPVHAGPLSPNVTNVQRTAPKRTTPREHPQVTQVAAVTPKTIDTAAQRATVAAVANTDSVVAPPVTSVVTVQVATMDSTPAKVDSTTPKVDAAATKVDTAAAKRDSMLAKVDTTWVPGEGTTIIKGDGRPKNRRWWWPWGRKG